MTRIALVPRGRATPELRRAYDQVSELWGFPSGTPMAMQIVHPLQALVPELRELHEQRAEMSPDFIYLIDQIERTREMREREKLSLNEQIVKVEREENRRSIFEAENMRRFLKGLPLREWETDDEESDEDETPTQNNNDTNLADNDLGSDSVDEDDEGDPLLLESGRVLADFIALNERQLAND